MNLFTKQKIFCDYFVNISYLQNRNRLTDIDNKLTNTKGDSESGEDKLGVWD